jgi:hypothetical protein
MSTPESGHAEGSQSTPEAQYEIIIPSDKIHEVLIDFDGAPLAKDATWSIDRRSGNKYFSVEVKEADEAKAEEGSYTTFTPGPEYPGATWDKVLATTTNTLLTLSRRAFIGGETQASKSEGYKARQAKMRDRILEVTALTNENSPAAAEEMSRIYSQAEDEYRKFISSDISRETFDETEVNESLRNILAITTQLMANNPSGEASV